MNRCRVRCPAKVNLSLRVLHRRSDGYHELDTVFQAVALADRLTAAPAAELSLVCDDPDVPAGPGNLAWRAADRLRRAAGRPAAGLALRLEKRIPVEGGLGGGSSDAAGALLAAAHVWGLDLGREELAGIGGEVGADVPFFLFGGTARGTGRGDRIEPLPSGPVRPVLLGVPPFGVATREVFERLASVLTLPRENDNFSRSSEGKLRGEKDLAASSVNDLEAAVFPRHPELARFRAALADEGAAPARLSGSGSTVFGLFESETACRRAAARLGRAFPGFRLFETRTEPRGVSFEGHDDGG